MTNIVTPGSGILFMKVGTHANETLESIIERKAREIDQAGVAFWGYGGSTCHPQNMVQPFALSYEAQAKPIYLCMEEMTSNHWAQTARADEYSVNEISWELIPEAIKVIGSRYALVIKALREVDFDLPLDATRVALGNSRGAPGSKYIKGRVDKACLEVVAPLEVNQSTQTDGSKSPLKHIGLVAELAPPFAVYVRNSK